MTDTTLALAPPRAAKRQSAEATVPATAGSLVPVDTVAGRALIAVIAIMTFLAALAVATVVRVDEAARTWQAAVVREVTIQIRPVAGRDIEADVAATARLARETPGIAEVVPYSRAEAMRLLEPWLGTSLTLEDLPVPRLIVVRLDGAPDLKELRRRLAERVSAATLDDHRAWIERLRSIARTVMAVGLGVVSLVLAAAVLSVVFATRGMMASNRAIIEVLHLVGAKDRFIAREFQRNFLALGLKGGLIGGGAAFAAFALASILAQWFKGRAVEEALAALIGSMEVGGVAYAAVLGEVILIATVAALTSRLTVYRMLRSME
jgi:cell division transport system permease protein